MTDFREMSRDQIADYLHEHRASMAAHRFDGDIPSHWDVLVEDQGRGVAVVSRDVDDNRPLELEMLYILPEARGGGVGKAFVRSLFDEHYTYLSGDCYGEERERFFENLGFKVWRSMSHFHGNRAGIAAAHAAEVEQKAD